MSFIRINALQIGDEDWSREREFPYYVTWTYVQDVDADSIKKSLGYKSAPYDVVFIDKKIEDAASISIIERLIKPYSLFVTEVLRDNDLLDDMVSRKKGKYMSINGLAYVLDNELEYFYSTSHGEKHSPGEVVLRHGFKGSVKWNAGCSVALDGDYGVEFGQIVFWRHNIPVYENQTIDLWLEYIKDDSVDIELHLDLIVSGTVDTIYKSYVYTEEDMKNVVTIKNDHKDVNVFISLFAKGKGKLEIVSLHNRYSRGFHGHFLPGGQRIVTDNREEIFYYYNPGDMKPPLNVYFTRNRRLEGFEGIRMMDNMGSPYLLISDVRLEGGAFYLGSKEYETRIADTIRKHMYELGFNGDQVIMSGISMGAFAAMYYACDIKPHAVIVGKPILNMGSMAAAETLDRPGGFPTSLDILRFFEGSDDEAVRRMNDRFWNKFDAVKWDETSFIIMHMYEDDYDNQAYDGLISHIDSDRACVYGIGLHGRHNDNTEGIVKWFKHQYADILARDFYRSIVED